MSADRGRYQLSPKARQDLEHIWRYTFQTWSQAQADEYYGELTGDMSRLAAGSRHGKVIEHVRPGYFNLASGSHYIIYKKHGERIVIVRVLHQRMNIARHL